MKLKDSQKFEHFNEVNVRVVKYDEYSFDKKAEATFRPILYTIYKDEKYYKEVLLLMLFIENA